MLEKYSKWIHKSWFPHIEPALTIFEEQIAPVLRQRKSVTNIFPSPNLTFRALSYPLDEVKVVILGQDPYHDPGSAIGLAFANNNPKNPSPSLHNIMTEMINDNIDTIENYNVDEQKPLGEYHAEQGVLLLNTALTVEQGKPGSHLKLWEPFTIELLKILNQQDNLVWILWGRKAQEYRKYITNDTHFFIESVHPSPLSASRGFFGSKPFSKTNKILLKFNKNIKW